MAEPFVQDDFVAPTRFNGPGFQLEPLGPQHNQRDYDAWMSSIDHIRSTPGFDEGGDWPVEMSLEANLADLEMHARHFVNREGFTYSILDGNTVIGCLYIYPEPDTGHDALIRSWVRVRRAGMDVVVWETISVWIEESWPFEKPRYAPRADTR
ncbi:MAG: N-acetyltransferase [Acidimicrobiia bacterium]